MWLKAPVVEPRKGGGGGTPWGKRNRQGTPQGGVISPLLSNLYLHWFDKVFHRQSGPAQWPKQSCQICRRLCGVGALSGQRACGWIEAKIEGWLGLEINRDKTRVVELSQAGAELNFLDICFATIGTAWEASIVSQCDDVEESAQAGEERLRERINHRVCFKPLPQLIEELNRHLKGWRTTSAMAIRVQGCARSTGTYANG